MNTARIVVLIIALGAGGVAAYLASGSDNKSLPSEPVAHLQTVDVLVAKFDVSLGQTVTSADLQWQTWPAATASNTFIRRNDQAPKETDSQNSVAGKTETPGPRPERPETLARPRQSDTLALRSIADVNVIENLSDDQAPKRARASAWFATAS
jgi:pilus assembly protein CpaB